MAEGWQIKSDGKVYGPLTVDEIRHGIAGGHITRETPVRPGQNSVWVLAGTIDLFFPREAAPTPVPVIEPTSATVVAIPIAEVPTPMRRRPPQGPRLLRPLSEWLSRPPTSWRDVLDWRLEVCLAPLILYGVWLALLVSAVVFAGYLCVVLVLTAVNAEPLTVIHGRTPTVAGEMIDEGDAWRFDPSRLGSGRLTALNLVGRGMVTLLMMLVFGRLLAEGTILLVKALATIGARGGEK